MDNVKYEVKNGKLLIEIDLSQKAIAAATPSKNGGALIIASTRGNEQIPTQPSFGGKRVNLSLNVTTSKS